MASPNKYGARPIKAQSVQDISLLSGGIYISDTATYTGPFIAIQALEASTVADLTSTPSAGGIQGTLNNVPLPTGALVVGPSDTVKLDASKVIAYFGPFGQ